MLISKTLLVSLVAIRTYCLFYMIISDCDEVFNYWEPLNFLLRGFGKQTWEYSPEYAIRSWSFLLPYFVVLSPLNQFIKLSGYVPNYVQFYIVRAMLVIFTITSEIKLYNVLHKYVSSKIANWVLFFSLVSPGMSHAGVSLLPSSFAMNCNLLAISNITKYIHRSKPKQYGDGVCAISWFLIGGLMGWPFALALASGFGVYVIWENLRNLTQLSKFIQWCFVSLMVIVGSIVQIDGWFYDKTLLVPLNIVLYNVFGGEGEGPEIFGVEPFSYYVLNLLLNFNIIAVFGYIGLVCNVPFSSKHKVYYTVVLSPLLVWTLIFANQPHKEERFLYPIYPLINLSAGICINSIMTLFNKVTNAFLYKRLNKFLNLIIVSISVISIGTVSILRIVNLVENYSSPLTVYRQIPQQQTEETSICVGREWYHYPSSFFLPHNMRLKFVQSGFDGLLPGDFNESNGWAAISQVPPNMNNKNIFDASKLTDFAKCGYYIDISESIDVESGEVEIISPLMGVNPEWEVVYCDKFINSANSFGIGKVLYIPKFMREYIGYDVDYTNYCLLKRKN